MNIERFNPDNNQYKKVEDLPADKRSDFRNVDNGFVTKEAADGFEKAEIEAREKNKKRPIREKIIGKNKVSGVDILQDEAIKQNIDFDIKQRENKKEVEKQLKFELTNNVTRRELFSYIKGRESMGVVIEDICNQDEALKAYSTQFYYCIRWLLLSGNDLAKTQKLVDSHAGDGEYEKERELFESLHEKIIEEEKRLALCLELRKRHPINPLFKTNGLMAPEGVENRRSYVSVFCATHERNLDQVGENGLKFAGEEIMDKAEVAAGKVNTTKMKLERIFGEVAPAGYNRRYSVYAVPEYRDPERSGAMARMGDVILEIKVDADRAMVFDVEKYNSIAESMHLDDSSLDDSDFRKEALEAARSYWDSGMPLSKYLKLPLAEQKKLFTTPEILIPDTVSPEQVKVASVVTE
ncbi:MAG: hypothetical protein Q7K35_05530 [bacterium]|nr:hypothetical protein [bacterium]